MEKLTADITNIGVEDRLTDLFEGQYRIPDGIRYNSYLVADERASVFDTVGEAFIGGWLENLDAALGGAEPAYLIVQHMEPDHSAGITAFMRRYPGASVVANAKVFAMMKQFYGDDFDGRRTVIADGDTLSTGRHAFTFIFAPMVHWPEVTVTFDSASGTLFSADAFGTFGIPGDWEEEAARYYFGIVGKYGAQVQSLLGKLPASGLERICPLHGPVLTDSISRCVGLYDLWSSYRPEREGALVAYASVYGHTKAAAERLAARLGELGCPEVRLCDLARDDMHRAVADSFRMGTLVLAATTYNMDVFPPMRNFISHLAARGFRGRRVALIENGSWAPQAAKVMKGLLEGCRDISFAGTVTIKSAPDAAASEALESLALELAGRK